MKSTNRNVLVVASLVLNLFSLPNAYALGKAPKRSDVVTSATLAQSVPEATDLGQPGMAYAKDVWIQMINGAKATIDVEQMYVSGNNGKSDATNDVLAALEAASARGVKIRLVLAQAMIDTDTMMLDRLKKIPTLTLGVVDYGKINGGIQHSKFWIVDGHDTFLGSQNLDYLALTEIHEVGVRIQDDTIAARMKSIFDIDFTMAQTGKAPTSLGTTVKTPADADIELVASPPTLNPKNVRAAIDALKELLALSQNTVRIQVMEYSTFSGAKEWKEIDNAIRGAAKRGVKVQLLVSHWSTAKPAVTSIKNLSLVPNIEVRICTVPDLPTGHTPYSRLIHSKYMIIDDSTLWVGSSNWSKGYFDATRGIEMIMKRPDLASQAVRMFNTVWNEPYTVPVDVNKDYPKPIR